MFAGYRTGGNRIAGYANTLITVATLVMRYTFGYWGGARNYQSFKQGWDTNVKPVADIAPIIITETDWAPQFYKDVGDYIWGIANTGVAGGNGFGANLKYVTDQSGNVSWNVLAPENLLHMGDPNGEWFTATTGKPVRLGQAMVFPIRRQQSSIDQLQPTYRLLRIPCPTQWHLHHYRQTQQQKSGCLQLFFRRWREYCAMVHIEQRKPTMDCTKQGWILHLSQCIQRQVSGCRKLANQRWRQHTAVDLHRYGSPAILSPGYGQRLFLYCKPEQW